MGRMMLAVALMMILCGQEDAAAQPFCEQQGLGVCRESCLAGEREIRSGLLCPESIVGSRVACCSEVCGEWSEWSPCSTDCGPGQMIHVRECECEDCDVQEELADCNPGPCPAWGIYSPWTTCTKSCGGGTQQRRRNCMQNGKMVGLSNCEGNGTEVRSCNVDSCPDLSCGKSNYVAPRMFNAGVDEQCASPWYVHFEVTVGTNRTTTCSGVLVDKNSILTTGQCAKQLQNSSSSLRMVVGDYNSSSDTENILVEPSSYIYHTNYSHLETIDSVYTPNDFAVIQLKGEITLGTCRNYVCLPDRYRNITDNQCKVISFGSQGSNASSPSNLLQATNPRIGSEQFCYAALGFQKDYPGQDSFNKNFLCGSEPGDYSFCKGDEAAVMTCQESKTGQWLVAALGRASYDQVTGNCTSPRSAMVYTKVQPALDWIRQVIVSN